MPGKYKPRNTPTAIHRRRLKELREKGLKQCPKCNEILLFTKEFWTSSGWCRKCVNAARIGCKDVNTERAKLRKLNQRLEDEGFRYCPKCEEKKPRTLDFFSKKTQNKGDGLNTYCKECETNEHKQKYAEKMQDADYRNQRREYSLRQYYKNRESYAEKSKKWRQGTGRATTRAAVQKYRAIKKKACPSWISDKQLDEIRQMYKRAVKLEKQTGDKYHVDHIVPLRGENVCGLHVPWNLQVLTAFENISKGNKWPC